VSSIDSWVLFEPVPAMTWTRPFAASTVDLDAALRRLDRQLHHAAVLGVGEGGRLAGGAAGHHPVEPRRHLPLHQLAQRRLVDAATPERRD